MLFIDQCLDSRYKLMVQVLLGERHGAGIKSGARCIWDADTDTLAYDQFLNVSLNRQNTFKIIYEKYKKKEYWLFLKNF